MTTRPATTNLACLSAGGELAISVVTVDVATAAAEAGAPPDWIKISPRGAFSCRDGRTYTLEPDAIIARFAADGAHVPVDVGHETVRNNAAPALAWVNELQARPDGLYGRVEWLAGGKALLAARTHRYVSPAFHHDDQNRATWLHSVALVAAPALARMPAIASAGYNQEPSMKGIATAVGLQENASEAAILSAISAGFVKKVDHDGTVAQLAAVSTELAALKKASHDADVERVLEEALKAQRMVPAQKSGFAAMAATAEGLVNVKAILAATAEGSFAGASVLDTRRPATGTAAPKDGATLAAEAGKYAKEHGVSFVDAMAIITNIAKPKSTS